MKKTLIVFILLLTICGCSNKTENRYDDFEHSNLSGKDIISYTNIDDDGLQHKYAIADITPDSHEIFIYGLFYQISSDDFILLTKIESSIQKEYVTKFYGNKLYVLDQNGDAYNIEYTLDKEKISKKELNFNFYKGFAPYSINDIQENYIYYSAHTNDDSTGSSISVKIKCSLNTYECELNEH